MHDTLLIKLKAAKAFLSLTLLIILTACSAMAYHTNTDLANSADELKLVQAIDDETTNLSSIAAIEAAAADNQHEHYESAQRMLARIDNYRSDADELINTFLRGNYEVPLDPVPAFITDISIDLTKHKIFKHRLGMEMEKHYKQLESDSISKLEKIQRGQLKISKSPDIQASHFRTNKKKSDRVWNDDLLDRY